MVSCLESVGLLSAKNLGSSTLHDGLNLHSVGWIGDEEWKLLLHANLRKAIDAIKVVPELGLIWLSGLSIDLNLVHTNGLHDSLGTKEALVLGKVWSKTSLGINVLSNVEVSSRS